jgi:hypothetical protein
MVIMERKIRAFLHMFNKLIKTGLGYLNEELWVKGFGVEERHLIYDERRFTLRELVELARRDWEQAKALFEEVNEPDMVDHAIYAIEAAERKYMYLLKRAKEEKVVDIPYYQIGENKLA